VALGGLVHAVGQGLQRFPVRLRDFIRISVQKPAGRAVETQGGRTADPQARAGRQFGSRYACRGMRYQMDINNRTVPARPLRGATRKHPASATAPPRAAIHDRVWRRNMEYSSGQRRRRRRIFDGCSYTPVSLVTNIAQVAGTALPISTWGPRMLRSAVTVNYSVLTAS
jgi:hypothetical protein